MSNNFSFLFGEEAANANTIEQAAQKSKKIFLRTTGQLYLYEEPNKGRKLSAFEALERYGENAIKEVIQNGVAVIFGGKGEPGKTLQERRKDCQIKLESLAGILRENKETLERIESNNDICPIRIAERIASFLDLDERFIANKVGAFGDPNVATRLRTCGENEIKKEKDKIKFLEAAWIIRTYYRVCNYLHEDSIDLKKFEDTPYFGQYGSYDFKTYLVGYELANFTRQKLGIEKSAPILSMRKLCEDQFNIPIISSQIDDKNIYGATISSNSKRGILINFEYLEKHKRNVFVRRNTIAHELCHFIFDSDKYLNKIIIDNKSTLNELNNKFANNPLINIERRANAFAAEFLAPQEAVLEIFKSKKQELDGIKAVMEHFGVSFSVARFQIQNADRNIQIPSSTVDFDVETDSWIAAEDSITSCIPDRYRISPQRMGKFAKLVLMAQRQNFISDQTANIYLGVNINDTELVQYLSKILFE